MLPLAEEEARLSRGEMEAQGEPEVGGSPTWGEVRQVYVALSGQTPAC